MKIPYDNLSISLFQKLTLFVLIKKEKKKGETEKELIGNLSYIKCIASLSVELSSCYLAYIGMGQDKIPLPHQVRSIIVS